MQFIFITEISNLYHAVLPIRNWCYDRFVYTRFHHIGNRWYLGKGKVTPWISSEFPMEVTISIEHVKTTFKMNREWKVWKVLEQIFSIHSDSSRAKTRVITTLIEPLFFLCTTALEQVVKVGRKPECYENVQVVHYWSTLDTHNIIHISVMNACFQYYIYFSKTFIQTRRLF